MSMQLKVNDKEYTVTYGFRAMYESEFIKEMFNTVGKINSNDEDKEFEMLAVLAPRTTNMLLVGLQEEHADEFKTFEDVYTLLKQYFKENENNTDITMLGLYTKLMNVMEEDGFLAQIGLVEKKEVKTPQDHKKKATTTSKK